VNQKMKDYNAKIVGDNIKNYRLAKNLSQKELGKRADVSGSYIGLLENGTLSKNSSGSLEVICKIADVLGVTLDDLAGNNLECRENEMNGLPLGINRIMLEMENTTYSKLLLFQKIVNALIK
jgi:transcriptional regulator with XRE-family HTH domain